MSHIPSFHVVGVSHHSASVGERERLAPSPPEIAQLLKTRREAARSALLLSTCNRCELYWNGGDDGETWFGDFARSRGSTAVPIRHDGVAAMRHLFTVAAGLDSQILGETEILGQVRKAYDAARAAGTTTPDMDLIFSRALSAGRRVRSETMLGRHPASVSSAAVELIATRWDGGIGRKEVLVLGAGELAEGVLRALHERGAARVTLMNRNPERARVAATTWGAGVGFWGELEARLETADLLLVATSSARPVVTAAQLAEAARTRAGRTLFVVDLAVPRNVEPAARGTVGVELFDLDDLQRLCCPAAGMPSAALAEAERVIEEELIRLDLNLRSRAVAPRLAELHRLGAELAEQESAWALAQLETLSQAQQNVIRQMADRLVRRVLYPVSRNLRSE